MLKEGFPSDLQWYGMVWEETCALLQLERKQCL